MSYQERRSHLLQLRRRRDLLLDNLNDLLGARSKRQEQCAEREFLLGALESSRSSAQTTQAQLVKARSEAEAQLNTNAQRRVRLERLQAQLQNNRTEMLSSYFPHLLRYQSLTYQHVSSMLLHEQRLKLKQLLDILPLRVEGMGGSTQNGREGTALLSICALRVPEQALHLVDGRLTPEASSAALGYTLLLLDLLATYLGGPLLHEGSFQGSTTVIWQQQSFWNRRPASSNSVLPLFVEDMHQTNILLPAAKPSTSSWSLGGLMRTGSSPDPAAGTKSGMEMQRQDSLEGQGLLHGSKYGDLQAAHSLLQRSISCFVRDLVALVPGVYLPASWSAVSWLVMLCALYHRDSRIEGLVQAAQSLAESTAAAGVASVATVSFPPSSSASTGQGATADADLATQSGGGASRRDGMAPSSRQDEEEVEEDWDVLLPPKPSESDSELEHWTQAMMPSRAGQMQQRASLSSLGAAAAAARSALGLQGGVQEAWSRSM